MSRTNPQSRPGKEPGVPHAPTDNPRLVCAIAAALAIATLLAFAPVRHHDFVNYDDEHYVVNNAQVTAGLTWSGVKWAFTAFRSSNWHPLTWLSHMLDCEFFGLNAGGHHVTSLVIHMANAVLLLVLLWRLTRAPWCSAVVASIFALHPLRVESVAWISERKDVLSTFFFMLTLLAYGGYAARRRSGVSRAWQFYVLALFLFAAGLMSKPMLVTLPFILLLLDYWPLERFELNLSAQARAAIYKLTIEKIPFFALTVASCVVTWLAQRKAMPSLDYLPMLDRLGNASVSYVRYLHKTVWPENLSVFYPHPGTWPSAHILAATVVILLVSLFVILLCRTQKYLLFGWCWYLGMLVPVIGLVQVGSQSIADRYMYLPGIGLVIMFVWGACASASRWRLSPALLALPAALILVLCGIATRQQVGHWQNSESLFRQALAVTTNNVTAHFGLGKACADRKDYVAALAQFELALRLKPDFAEVQGQIAFILASEGKTEAAIERYTRAIESNPRLAEALNNLAWLRATHPDATFRNGAEAVRLAERACGMTQYQRTIFIGTLAAAYAEAARFPEAVAAARRAQANARHWGETNLFQRNRELEALYEAQSPFRDSSTPPP